MVSPGSRKSVGVIAGAVLLALATVSATTLHAQDIEARAAAKGITLPASYYAQIQAQPELYEFRRALFNRVTPDRTSSFGVVEIPVILALFSDSEEPFVSRDDVQAVLFDGPAPRGTITEAYEEMSLGALTVTGDVYGWTRTSLTMTQVVGTDRSFGPDNRVGEYLVEALTNLDPEIDFARFDNDGPDGIANSGDDDGFVDVVTFEYLEVSASCGGPAIWPHRSSLQGRSGSPFKTDDVGINGDTIYVQDYITQGATDCEGANVQDAAVITHEFGHALGMPDWYHWIDTDIGPFGRRWVMGCWALMAAGSWGCGPVTESRAPFGPTHMLGYTKEYLGWIDYIDPGEVWNEEIVLDPIQTSGDVLRVPLDDAGDEFLIIEFRGLIGFDHQIPAAGVLMYKLDENASIRPDPSTNDPYFLTMLEQDANRSLVRMATEGGSRGEPGDAWGVDGVSSPLNAETLTSLRLADGSWTSVQVHEVYAEGESARIVISTGRTPQLVAPTGAVDVERVKTFLEPVRIAGGVGPYSGTGDLPNGFSLEVSGDELFLVGSVQDEGPFDFTFAVEDAAGNVSNEVTLTVTGSMAWTPDVPTLMRLFLQSEGDALTPGELLYLDEAGNDNGQYDVGDLRAWLRENR